MKNIEQIVNQAKKDQWPYPKTFDALKEAGVVSYAVHFSQVYKAEYKGTFGSWFESAPEGYHPISVSSEFSGEGVKTAIIRHMEKKTSYVECIQELGRAGVSHYLVDMNARTVTYFNPSESESQVENVPEWHC